MKIFSSVWKKFEYKHTEGQTKKFVNYSKTKQYLDVRSGQFYKLNWYHCDGEKFFEKKKTTQISR